MPITELLERNAQLYGSDVALVEVNPEITEVRRKTWKEYELIEPDPECRYRREITWKVFDEKANRFANMLLERGVQKGDKVGILLMNCLEWLPIYFGILKTGALAVPLNFRYTADEIKYCLDLAEVDILMFGPEFIGRVEEIAEDIVAMTTPIRERIIDIENDSAYLHRVLEMGAERARARAGKTLADVREIMGITKF